MAVIEEYLLAFQHIHLPDIRNQEMDKVKGHTKCTFASVPTHLWAKPGGGNVFLILQPYRTTLALSLGGKRREARVFEKYESRTDRSLLHCALHFK